MKSNTHQERRSPKPNEQKVSSHHTHRSSGKKKS
jgi:hypothetical protein